MRLNCYFLMIYKLVYIVAGRVNSFGFGEI